MPASKVDAQMFDSWQGLGTLKSDENQHILFPGPRPQGPGREVPGCGFHGNARVEEHLAKEGSRGSAHHQGRIQPDTSLFYSQERTKIHDFYMEFPNLL